MATPSAAGPLSLPLPSGRDFPSLIAAYLPSPSSDDEDAAADSSFLDDDSPDSLDDWSDDRPDSADDYDHTSDSDDSSLAWNSSKPKKHSHPHPHPHPHPHSHHKKNSCHSACDYLPFFSALRKGFCSRPLDQRIEIYKAHKRADKSTVIGGGDTILQEKKRVIKTGTGGVSGGYTFKDNEGAASFSAMFKCTVVDTPKNLLKRASFSENSDEQDINEHQAGAENACERDAAESDKKMREQAEREKVAQLSMVLERDGKGSSEKFIDGPQPTDNVCKDMSHKEYGESQVELGTHALPNKSKLRDENSNSKEDNQPSKYNKASEKQSCWRESDQKGLHKKGDWKHALPDSTNKSLKNENQVPLVNTLEPKDEGGVCLENNAIEQSKDLQGKTIPFKDNLCEAAEMPEVPTPLDQRITQTEATTDKAKVQDVPLQIYIKEKHPLEVGIKDSKRKTKAKKVKAPKGKKVHLFRDGFTLPSAVEPADDAKSTPVLDRQSESSNKVQALNAAIKTQILKEVVSSSATEDMQAPPIRGNALGLDGVLPLRDAIGPVATPKSSATSVHIIKTQEGNPASNDSGLAVVALPDSVPNIASHVSPSYMEDGASNISFTEGRQAAQLEAQSFGSLEENSTRTVITATLPPLQKASRSWFPPFDVALHDPVLGSEFATTLNGSLLVPQPSVGNSLATSTSIYSPTAFSHESESNSEGFGNIQGNLVPIGNTTSSASPNPSAFIDSSLVSHHLGKRVAPPAMVSPSPRMLTVDSNSAQYSKLIQAPVAQSQACTPNSVPALSLQQEINPPALFHIDSRASGKSSWIQPGTNSGSGFPFRMVTKTASFGQVIGCVNQTLSMYKQMKSFSIEARYLVNVSSIIPGCCKLFLFNIENRQLHGLYVSSSLPAIPVGHEFPVAFDCIENYSIPLSVDDLDTVLPEARQMDGRPLFLEPQTVEQLVTMFERKNKPRLSWVSSTTNAVSLSGVHGLLELNAASSECSSTQDRLVESMGQGSSVISASPASMTIIEAATDCWSPLSSSPSAKVSESGQALSTHEPDPSLASAQVFPFPASSINSGEGAKPAWSEVSQSGFTRKMPEQGVAPSPMALWPHLFPKASSADTTKESFMLMETREGNNTPLYVSEKFDMGGRPDSESEPLNSSQIPETGFRSIAHRPKLAYNPLAVEQGRQRYLFDGSKPSSWSTLVPELDLQQTSQYGNRPRSQDNPHIALSSPLISEQLKTNNMSGGATSQSSAKPGTHLPLHYQMDHALPDALRSDLGLSKPGTAQTPWSEEQYSMHLPTTSEAATGAANFDQTNLCCYCFKRRADHLIIDCQHLGPCLECAASKKIEYCGQLNCQTKVTRLLRLFR